MAEIQRLGGSLRECCKVTATSPVDPSTQGGTSAINWTAIPAAVVFLGVGVYHARRGSKGASIVLLTTSGLLTLSGTKLLSIDKVFETKSLLSADMSNATFGRAQSKGATFSASHEFATIGTFDVGSADLKPLAFQAEQTGRAVCAKHPAIIFAIGRADRRELRRAIRTQYGTNWALAEARAAAITKLLEGFGCRAVTLSSPPQFPADDTKPEDMANDRSVTLHSLLLSFSVLS